MGADEEKKLEDEVKTLKDGNKTLTGKIATLERNNSLLNQLRHTICGFAVGLLLVTIGVGLCVSLMDTFGKAHAAVLIIAMLCWTGLTALVVLVMASAAKNDD